MEKTIKSTTKKSPSVKAVKEKVSLNVKETKVNKLANNTNTNEDPYPITLKKAQVKKVLDMFTGTKNTPKTSIVEISKILQVDKKQVIRVLHKHGVKLYKESSLK